MSTPPPVPPTASEASAPAYVAPPAEANQRGVSGCLVSCLVVAILCVLLCGGLGIYAYSQAKHWATDLAKTFITTTIDESKLPEEEKLAIKVQVDRVATAYEEGEISLEELGQILEELGKSKIWGLVLVQAIDANYIDPSGLTDEEKQAGKRAINRVLRGSLEGQISDEALEALSEHFLEETAPETKQLKNELTDEELRALIQDATALADDNGVPDEDYEVQFSERIREIVDEALR